MNLRSEIIIEIIKNERTYRFSMPVGATFAECAQVSLEVTKAIDEMAKEAEARAKAQKAEEVEAEIVERN